MNKPWIGYLSAGFLLLAGVFQVAGGNPKIGILFILLAIASVIINIYIGKQRGGNNHN
jgi:hypothetical protein